VVDNFLSKEAMPVHVSGVALISRWILRSVGLPPTHFLGGRSLVTREDVLVYPQSLISLHGMSVELTKQYGTFEFNKQQ
jgi:hypothetical protein